MVYPFRQLNLCRRATDGPPAVARGVPCRTALWVFCAVEHIQREEIDRSRSYVCIEGVITMPRRKKSTRDRPIRLAWAESVVRGMEARFSVEVGEGGKRKVRGSSRTRGLKRGGVGRMLRLARLRNYNGPLTLGDDGLSRAGGFGHSSHNQSPQSGSIKRCFLLHRRFFADRFSSF